jgi:hypothetical protein
MTASNEWDLGNAINQLYLNCEAVGEVLKAIKVSKIPPTPSELHG